MNCCEFDMMWNEVLCKHPKNLFFLPFSNCQKYDQTLNMRYEAIPNLLGCNKKVAVGTGLSNFYGHYTVLMSSLPHPAYLKCLFCVLF